MKSILEYVVDDKFENYLLDRLESFIILNENYLQINEAQLNLFDNYKEILDIILKDIKKIPQNFEEKQIKISINSVQEYPKNIFIDVKRIKEGIRGAFYNCTKNGDVSLNLYFGEGFRMQWNKIRITILHELMHGYQEYIRISNNQPSIFDEYTREYRNATMNLSKEMSKSYIVRYIAFLKYFFNDKEKEAYFATLELKFLDIINKIKPSFSNIKFDKIKNLIKQDDIWQLYFNFGKFTLNIDNIDDEELEDSYAEICETIEDERKRRNNHIDYLKRVSKGEQLVKPSNKKISPKKADEIRKECKEAWKEFVMEFDSKFLEVFMENVPQNF